MYNYLPAVSFGSIPVNTTSFSLGNAEYANFNSDASRARLAE